MCAAAASTPEAMTVLAVQKLWYNMNPSAGIGVFLILSTQMLGYGVAGLLRKTLVYPSKMLYPMNLPTASLLENLHRDRKETKKRMRVFYIAFATLLLWQAFPQYISKFLILQQKLHTNVSSARPCRSVSLLPDKPAQSFCHQSFRWFNGKRRTRCLVSLFRLDHDL
jgi:hypothetical protein